VPVQGCTLPYSRAIPLLPLWAVRPVQSLSACTRVHFTFLLCIMDAICSSSLKVMGGNRRFYTQVALAYVLFVYEKTLQSWWFTCFCPRRTWYSQTFLRLNLGCGNVSGCRFVVSLHGSTAFVYPFFSFN
jgi:hypothetical protein